MFPKQQQQEQQQHSIFFLLCEKQILFSISFMECDKVINEVDKVITKFSAISEHASKVISSEIHFLGQLKDELNNSELKYSLF